MGQSNSVGWRTGGASFSTLNLGVEVWDNDREWGANKGSQFNRPVQGSRPYNVNGENNSGVWLCHRIAQATGQNVRHILSGRRGQGIENWVGGARPGWDDMAAIVASIESAGHTVRPFDVFFWQGSEGNQDHTVAQYRAWWNELIAALVAGNYITATTPILIAAIKRATAAHIDAEHQSIAASDPRAHYVPDFVQMTADDGVHWSGASQVMMGSSAFCAWQNAGG